MVDRWQLRCRKAATLPRLLHEACIVVSVGGPYRVAVEKMVFKVVEWYRAEVDLREQGMEPLLMASELWNDFRWVRIAS
jgi:hypothetical protein